MPESTKEARPVRSTPEREVAEKAPAEKAERSDRDVAKFLAKRAAREAPADTEEEAEARVRADLERLWPSSK